MSGELAAIKESIAKLKGKSIADINFSKNKPPIDSKTETNVEIRISGLKEKKAK